MTRFTFPNTLEAMTNKEIARHLVNLIALVVAAMKSSIDILKFIKNCQMISAKSLPDTMWWFDSCCNQISSTITEWCPKAPKVASAQFPVIAVVVSQS
jgi:hypothetical protein